MLWLFLSVIVAFIWSISAFIDNYVTDVIFKKKKPQSMKVFDGLSYLVTATAIFFFLGIESLDIYTIGWMILAGALASIATVPYYLALRDEEATTSAIFYQLSPVLILVVEWSIFKQSLTWLQTVGLAIILIAPIIIIFSRKRPKSRRMEFGAALLLTIFVIICTTSTLITTHAGSDLDFVSIFFWFLIGRGASDLILYATHQDWQQRMKYIWRRNRIKFVFALLINQLISIIAEFLNRYALIIGIASLVSATCNVLELIITFMLGIILSIIWPKFGREKLERHVIIAHLIATILASIGILLIQ